MCRSVKQLYRRGEIGGRLDRDDVAALVSQNVLDDHGSLPDSGRGANPRYPSLPTIRSETGSVNRQCSAHRVHRSTKRLRR